MMLFKFQAQQAEGNLLRVVVGTAPEVGEKPTPRGDIWLTPKEWVHLRGMLRLNMRDMHKTKCAVEIGEDIPTAELLAGMGLSMKK